MIITRRAREKDIKDIIQLADLIFRINNNLKPSMGIQFPFLLSEKNASNLLVAEDDGRIISHKYFLNKENVSSLTHYTVNSVEIDINMYETEFIQLYRGIQSEERYSPCTYLIVNPQKFIGVIEPLLKERNYDKPLMS